MAELPINPERRDPGVLRKKSEIGLSKVDNLSSADLANVILDLAKDKINELNTYEISRVTGKRKIGILQFKGKTEQATAIIALKNATGDVLEAIRAEFIYTPQEDLVSNGTIEYRTLVSIGGKFLEETFIQVYEKKETDTCSIIIELPDSTNGTVTAIGINVFEYSAGTVLVDSSKVNDTTLYSGFTLLTEFDNSESRIGSGLSGSSLGLAVYDNVTGKIVKVKPGEDIPEGSDYDYPTINTVPFIAYKDTDVEGKSGRNIVIQAYHDGPTKNQAGVHNWEVLGDHPQVGLEEQPGEFVPTIYSSPMSGYGLSRISRYPLLPKDTDTTDRMITNILSWGNGLSTIDSDVVPVGALKEFVSYVARTMGVLNGSILPENRYTFFYSTSSQSVSESSSSATEYNYRIISGRSVLSTTGSVVNTYPDAAVSGIDQGTSGGTWIQASIQGTGDNQTLKINVSENNENSDRRGRVTIQQDISGNYLYYDIIQRAGSVQIGFRINESLVLEGTTYNSTRSSEAFSNIEYKIYPVVVYNSDETRPDITEDDVEIEKIEGSWLTYTKTLETYTYLGQTKNRISLKISGTENTSVLNSRTGTLDLRYSGQSVSMKVNQSRSGSYIYFNGDQGTSTYTFPTDFSENGENKSVTITSNNSWEVIEHPSFVTVTPATGPNGDTEVIIGTTKNTSTSPRSGEVKIKAGNAQRSILVTQKASSVILLLNGQEALSLGISAEGGSSDAKNITVRSNVVWTITNVSSAWLTPDKTTGGTAGTDVNTSLRIQASANTNRDGRSATITLSGGGITRTISITQSGTGQIIISPEVSTLTLDWNDLTVKTVNVQSNDIYDIVSEDTNILTVQSSSAGSTGQGLVSSSVKFSLKANNSTARQKATRIKLTSRADNTKIVYISVTQKGNLTLTLSSSTLTVPALQTTPTDWFVTATTNASGWTALVSSGSTWLSCTDSGISGGRITLTALENITDTIRQGTVLVSASYDDQSGTSLTRTLTVTQSKATIEVTETIIDTLAKTTGSTYIAASGGRQNLLVTQRVLEVTTINGGHRTERTLTSNYTGTSVSGLTWELVSDSSHSSIARTATQDFLDIQENSLTLEVQVIVRAKLGSITTPQLVLTQQSADTVIWEEFNSLVLSYQGAPSPVEATAHDHQMTATVTKKVHSISGGVDTVISTTTEGWESLSRLEVTAGSSFISNPTTIFQTGIAKFLANSSLTSSRNVVMTGYISYVQHYPNGTSETKTISSPALTVTQKAKPGTISVSPGNAALDYPIASTVTVNITSDTSWTISKMADFDTYFTLSRTSGTGNGAVVITTKAENTSTTSQNISGLRFRTDSLGSSNISEIVYDVRQRVKVIYNFVGATPDAATEVTALVVPAISGQRNTYYVNSNASSWNILPSSTELYDITPLTGPSGNTAISVISKANNFWPTVITDLGTSRLTSNPTSGNKDYQVHHAASAPILQVSSSNLILQNTSGINTQFGILSNDSWTITTSGGGYTVSSQSGQGTNTEISISVSPTAANNTTSTKELGKITIRTVNTSLTHEILIQQNPVDPYLLVPTSPITLGATVGEIYNYTFSTNYRWTVEPSATESSFSIPSDKLSGNAGTNIVIPVKVEKANLTTSAVNSGTIKVTCIPPATLPVKVETTSVRRRQAYPYIIADKETVIVPSGAGEYGYVGLTTNYELTSYSTTPASGVSLILDVRATSIGIAATTANTSTSVRKYLGTLNLNITDPLGDTSKNAVKVIELYQEVVAYSMNVSITDWTTGPYNSSGGIQSSNWQTKGVSLTSNAQWTSSIAYTTSGETGWLSMTPFSGTGNGLPVIYMADRFYKNMSFEEYAKSTAQEREFPAYRTPRTATITFETVGITPKITRTITVTQAGLGINCYRDNVIAYGDNQYRLENAPNLIPTKHFSGNLVLDERGRYNFGFIYYPSNQSLPGLSSQAALSEAFNSDGTQSSWLSAETFINAYGITEVTVKVTANPNDTPREGYVLVECINSDYEEAYGFRNRVAYKIPVVQEKKPEKYLTVEDLGDPYIVSSRYWPLPVPGIPANGFGPLADEDLLEKSFKVRTNSDGINIDWRTTSGNSIPKPTWLKIDPWNAPANEEINLKLTMASRTRLGLGQISDPSDVMDLNIFTDRSVVMRVTSSDGIYEDTLITQKGMGAHIDMYAGPTLGSGVRERFFPTCRLNAYSWDWRVYNYDPDRAISLSSSSQTKVYLIRARAYETRPASEPLIGAIYPSTIKLTRRRQTAGFTVNLNSISGSQEISTINGYWYLEVTVSQNTTSASRTEQLMFELSVDDLYAEHVSKVMGMVDITQA